jgi:two-component system response regulator AtoC
MREIAMDAEPGHGGARDELQVLIIDDEETFGRSLAMLLERRSARVTVAGDGAAGLRVLQSRPFDMVLLDHVLPDCRGLDLIGSVRSARPEPLVLMMTAYGTVDDAVEAMRRGAHDYIPKDADVRSIVDRVQLARALVESRRSSAPASPSLPPLIGTSQAMADVRHRLARVARSPDTTVLLTGESGTGKELAARTLHALDPATGGPFVAVDCVSLPATLAESELFGHERGSFTGAEKSRPGKLEAARGGTILLDEIGDMDLGLQAKLLRVLENRTITRIGSQKPILLEARVVAATNTDLAARVADGRFRLDLYHRLSVFQVAMPTLRERREDIPMLVDHLVEELAARLGRPACAVTPEGRELLRSYDYPGNVRELRNILEQAVIMCEGSRIGPADLPERLTELRGRIPPSRPARQGAVLLEFVPEQDSLSDVEDRLISQVLELAGGKVSRAARMLGISRFALSRRLSKRK